MDEISEEKHEERRTSDVRNMFRLYEIFPNAKELLGVRYKPLADIKGTSLVCLDTNILLIPFGVAPATLETIGNVYKRLRDTDRLIIPGHVIREFVSLRSKRLNEIVQTFYNKSSQLKDQKLKEDQRFEEIKLLANVPDYLEVLSIWQQIESLSKQREDLSNKLGKKIRQVASVVRDWQQQDPVSLIYQEVFEGAIYDKEFSPEEQQSFADDLRFRYDNKIPPGYPDRSKPDEGSGDLIIWKTILDIGKTFQRDLIFVTGDLKKDWWTYIDKTPSMCVSNSSRNIEEHRTDAQFL